MSGGNDWISSFEIQSDQIVHFRHVSPDDAELIAEAIQTASAETLLHRFFSPIRTVPLPALRNLLRIDSLTGLCFLGEIANLEGSRIICGARYIRETVEDKTAEIALTVHDEFQRRGLGTYLIRKLGMMAAESGITQFEGLILPSNVGMFRLIEKVSPQHQRFYLGETVRVVIPLQDLVADAKNS